MSLPIRQRNADAPSARSQSISNQNHIAQAADVRKETETTAHVATGEEKLPSLTQRYKMVDDGHLPRGACLARHNDSFHAYQCAGQAILPCSTCFIVQSNNGL
ncbi:hypothetical protein BDZ89DRAFT_1143394 [Hymenopellis radicata]|nr:hypothetical protein BDZ89DRAFT_1143394 [Hymenopellis radicata]